MFRSSGGHRVDSVGAWPVRSWAGDEVEEESLVADLRVTAAAYPDDARLASLVDRLLHTSPRFARLWSNGTAGLHTGDRKTIEHPLVGDLALDLDVLMVPGSDLRIVAYTAITGTDDAEKLDALCGLLPAGR
jgi:hypothetical protein